MSQRSWLIRGGRIIDPANAVDRIGDLLVQDGRIAAIDASLDPGGATVVDAEGLVVCPGLIDIHVHLREPGGEHKETIATGTAAAAAGGFTTICCMPNTRPALDRVEVLRDLAARVERDALVRVLPIAAITIDRAGDEAVDFEALAAAGAIGFSDDGDTTRDSAIMRRALEASRRLDRPIMVHCEDKPLAAGAMHEGEISRKLGIPGIPAEAEEIVIARDLMLTRLTGGWLHVCHVSTGRGIDLVRAAKREGTRVSAEVMPHHLLMDEHWVDGDRQLRHVDEPAGERAPASDPNTKVNPPLRTTDDTGRLLEALIDGSFDLIATDHAPHAASEKGEVAFVNAAFGINGLETALPLMLGLVRAGHLSLGDLIEKLTVGPARAIGMPLGTLTIGTTADLTVFDPDERWRVEASGLRTKSANTPLLGMEMQGRVRLTLVDGEERFRV